MDKNIGSLTISLDTEIAWGRISADELPEFYPLFQDTRAVIDRLLDLFDRYDMPATWALVGRLIDTENCNASAMSAPLDEYFGGDVAGQNFVDPVLNSNSNSYLNYPEIVQKIQTRNTKHELGSHSYNHFFFEELEDTELVKADFEAMKAVSDHHNFEINSLIFPKNQVAHLDVVAANGVKVFRGTDKTWFSGLPSILPKVCRQLDTMLPLPVSCVEAKYSDSTGLVDLPGSMIFRREHRGLKRHLPMRLLSAKANGALRNAVKTHKAVHLWFHPFNFAYKQEQHFHELESVLSCASFFRAKGSLEFRTMGDYVS